MPRVAVCLSGCGFLDGAEIHESVLTLLALDQAGAEIICCAPDVDQAGVTNHLTRQPEPNQRRNVLVESARIARGNIRNVKDVRAADIDALIFPGGYGAALNLSTFGTEGAACRVNPDVERLAVEVFEARKPIGAICIAPAMLARILGGRGVKPELTIGNCPETAGALEKMGVKHVDCCVTEFHVDREHKLVTTPAYMLGKGPAEVFEGIRKLVHEVLKMVG